MDGLCANIGSGIATLAKTARAGERLLRRSNLLRWKEVPTHLSPTLLRPACLLEAQLQRGIKLLIE
jgi:hypothetical protein